jgi:predicted Fe-Mo cluster-binding NifX family protein
MRICVAAEGPDLESDIGADIGHSPYLLVVDPETMEFEAFENEAMDPEVGADMKTAELIIQLGVDAIITADIGSREYERFTEAGMRVITQEQGPVMDAIMTFRHGRLPR